MIENSSPKHLKYINLICEKVKTKAEKEFVKYLYTEVSYEDLHRIDNEYLAKAAASTFKLLKHRKKNEFKINIHKVADNSAYAVLEILNDDIPFLIDSVSNELKNQGFDIHLIAHPIIHLQRNKSGEFEKFDFNGDKEAIIQFHLSNTFDDNKAKLLLESLNKILECVRYSTKDWRLMVTKMIDAVDETRNNVALRSHHLREESIEFLEWLINNHFVFLGCFELTRSNDRMKLKKGSLLGLTKSDLYPVASQPVDKQFESSDPLMIRKWERRSVVHRTAHMDAIVVKRFDRDGNCMGAYYFLGLFTSTVYYQSVRNIPLMRSKVSQVVKRYGYPESSHNCKELITALESFPRGEILQMSDDELYQTAAGIVSLSLVPRVKVFLRKDNFAKFIGAIIFIPEKKFSTEVREIIEKIICDYLHGNVSKRYVQIANDSMTRLQLVIKTDLENLAHVMEDDLEKQIANAISSWEDEFLKALKNIYTLKEATNLFEKYKDSFNMRYRSTFTGAQAVHDLKFLEKCHAKNIVEFDIYPSTDDENKDFINLKIYSVDETLPLTATLPIIENLGLQAIDEITHKIIAKCPISLTNERDFFIHHYRLKTTKEKFVLNAELKQNIIQTLEKVWDNELDDDRFNSLIIFAGASWDQVNALRVYAKFLKQANFLHSQEFIIETLIENPVIANKLIEFFVLKFDPKNKFDKKIIKAKRLEIKELLNGVESLAADKVMRGILNLINATVRTNFYQLDENGNRKRYLSIKIKSSKVDLLPDPKPYCEIFVYSTEMEANHLRGGPVARGGLRWSDRTEDFRTEVLGLMKAQMTKNSVIVPVGSKGGFVVKANMVGASREELFFKGVECYKTFLSGMLDITDNIKNNKIIKPENVVCHDKDDPYLVVAADKGTATFSDYANEVSKQYDFWLGDAFASGGSAGYDHKAMGITAKGAWVSVVRHFQEMGYNIDKEPFTVIGVGDMSGDVFGNGMLLSKNIKLLAAFNHMHIFIDPDPDPNKSYAERKRLFELPRSSWSDYDKKLISSGGGVFERSQKSINITPVMKQLFGIKANSLSPNELIHALLKAKVDLFWNGGIGTYMKSENESHDKIGDKANDTIRVNGKEMGAKIVGEGGNLGCTQLGRIEYAKNGGRINTDFIDNSAGVDCSDHEVNIKIGVSDLLFNNSLKLADRDKLLEKMTDDVAEHVLQDNYKQTLIISVEQNSSNRIYDHVWLMRYLEAKGQLNRAIEFLPNDVDLDAMMKENKKLMRPEISVLLAYSKNYALQVLCTCSNLEGKIIDGYFLSYFPDLYIEKFAKTIKSHKLRKEIINTILINDYVNTMGCTSFHQIIDDTNESPCKLMAAFIAVKEIFNIGKYWSEVEKLSGKIPVTKQTQLYNYLQQIVQRSIYWFLRNHKTIDCDELIKCYAQSVKSLLAKSQEIMTYDMKKEHQQELAEYVGKDESICKLVSEILTLKSMKAACDIKFLADKNKKDLFETAKYFYKVNESMHLMWLVRKAYEYVPKQYYQGVAMRSLLAQIRDIQVDVVAKAMKKKEYSLEKVFADNINNLDKFNDFINEIKGIDLSEGLVATITIAIQKINDLIAIKK